WMLIPLIGLFGAMAVIVLPGRRGDLAPPPPLPARQLVLLTAAVLAASIASVNNDRLWSLVSLLLAGLLAYALMRVDARAPQRLLPRGSFRIASPLGALYAMSALLAVTVSCTEIFVPLFLQELHGHSQIGRA